MKWKILWSVVVVLLIVLVVFFEPFVDKLHNTVSGDEAPVVSQESLSGIKEERLKNAVVIGMDANYPPMEFIDANAEMAGFDVDMIKVAFEKMGKPYFIKPMSWDKKTELLNNGDIDLIWSAMNITDERKEIYQMSNSYMSGEQVFVLPAQSDIETKEQIAGKRVGLTAGGFVAPILEKFSKSNPQGEIGSTKEFPDVASAMVGLLTNEVDVVIADGIAGRYYSSHSPGKFKILPELLVKTEGTGVAAKKGNTKLIDEVNNVLEQMKADGTMKQVYTKWFGE